MKAISLSKAIREVIHEIMFPTRSDDDPWWDEEIPLYDIAAKIQAEWDEKWRKRDKLDQS